MTNTRELPKSPEELVLEFSPLIMIGKPEARFDFLEECARLQYDILRGSQKDSHPSNIFLLGYSCSLPSRAYHLL
ncbi:unnamed protein product [Merluccius merluccius]